MLENPGLLTTGAPGPSEPLARYLTPRGHSGTVPRPHVKPSAFDPPRDLRLSVFRIGDLTAEQIWEIGQVNVIGPSSLTLRGRGDIAVSDVRKADDRLQIDCDNTPVRHACIIGWPSGDENKHERMLIAQKLAASASIVLRS